MKKIDKSVGTDITISLRGLSSNQKCCNGTTGEVYTEYDDSKEVCPLTARGERQNATYNNKLNELAYWRAEYNKFDVAVVNVNDPFIGGNIDTNIKNFLIYISDKIFNIL